MELLVEILFELLVGGSVAGANDNELPRGIRIGLLIFASLVYLLLTGFFVWLFLTAENMVLKVLSAGVALCFVAGLIFLWRKVMKK